MTLKRSAVCPCGAKPRKTPKHLKEIGLAAVYCDRCHLAGDQTPFGFSSKWGRAGQGSDE